MKIIMTGMRIWSTRKDHCGDRVREPGHAQAQNLRDSGLSVVVARFQERQLWAAVEDGFKPVTAERPRPRRRLSRCWSPMKYQAAVYKTRSPRR